MPPKYKGKKQKEVIPMTDEELQLIEEHVAASLKPRLPIGRVKKICRLDPDVEMINMEATMLLTKAAELFIAELGKAANTNAAMEKRKTVQLKDIDKCIQKSWTFAFLEDALDGWPKTEVKKRTKKPDGENTTILEEANEETGSQENAEMDETNHDELGEGENEGADDNNPENLEEEEEEEDEVVEESQSQSQGQSRDDEEKDPFADDTPSEKIDGVEDEVVQDSEYVDRFAEQF